jgi:hypothetical protein
MVNEIYEGQKSIVVRLEQPFGQIDNGLDRRSGIHYREGYNGIGRDLEVRNAAWRSVQGILKAQQRGSGANQGRVSLKIMSNPYFQVAMDHRGGGAAQFLHSAVA